jgi:hypothetical protein
VGEVVLDLRGWVDTLGSGDSVGAVAGTTVSAGEVAAGEDLGGAFGGMCRGGTDLLRVDDVDGYCLQPICQEFTYGILHACLG